MRCVALLVAFMLSATAAYAQEWTQEERTAGLKITEFTRYVPAGKQRVLDNFAVLNPDCTPANAETIITKPPAYGTAVLETRLGSPTFSKGNVRSKCNEMKMQIPMLIYKAGAGHTEPDVSEVTTISSNGMAFVVRYTIKIVRQ
jgi:hypothetical protein